MRLRKPIPSDLYDIFIVGQAQSNSQTSTGKITTFTEFCLLKCRASPSWRSQLPEAVKMMSDMGQANCCEDILTFNFEALSKTLE